MSDIWRLGAAALADAYVKGEISPVAAAKSALERIEAVNPRINAVFAVFTAEALEAAGRSERRWRDGAPLSAIDGLPITIKDSVAMKGTPYWRGCRANIGNVSSKDSPPVSRIKEAGGVIIGKTTMPDFGMLGAGVSSAHGVTRNPWNPAFNTGGSSSGASASLAAGIGVLTVGTDMAGSVRLPAAMCGLAGLKPTQGRIPHLPPSPVRSAGPIGRNVADMARFMTILAGPDARDFGSLPPDGLVYEDAPERALDGVRIGLCMDAGFGLAVVPEVRAAVERAAKLAEAAGAHISVVPKLTLHDPVSDLNLLFYLRSRLEYEAMPPEKRNEVIPFALEACEIAGTISAIDYAKSLDHLEYSKAAVLSLFESLDYMIMPAMPVTGFAAEAIGANPKSPLDHLNFMAMFNQTGQPAAVVNCGMSAEGLPIGLQIAGNRFDDSGVVQMAMAFEQMLDSLPGIAMAD